MREPAIDANVDLQFVYRRRVRGPRVIGKTLARACRRETAASKNRIRRAKGAQVTLLDHVDLRVRSISAARPLYDAIMPLLGFKSPTGTESDGCICYDSCTGLMESQRPFVALIEDNACRPSSTRIAFYAPERKTVDDIAAVAEAHGALAFEAAQLCPEYGPRYYACFFEDASGNKLEVCCRHASDEAEQHRERRIVRVWHGRTRACDIEIPC